MTARAAGGDLELRAPGDDGELRFPAIWLRDNCPCPQCRDPRTGQKLYGICDLPEDIAVATVEEGAQSITVTYSPDGHRSRFTRSWLAGHALTGTGPADHRTEDAKRLWRGAAGFPGATGLTGPAAPAGDWERRRWAALLAQPELALPLRLRPGDCLVFDNTRILHGRTAFTSVGGRHLQGCYADLDSLASSLAVLERQEVAA